MLSAVGVALAGTALLAGLTGTWSPCGFSMIDTLAAGARSGRSRVTAASCGTFAVGTTVGGVALFGGLAALGAGLAALGAGLPGVVGAGLVAGIAVGELAGIRVRPQVRRQVPEHWRRAVPLPIAALGYGGLLGLGFTTFVLTLAVPGLAVMMVALGDPALGLLVGAAFGAGRALPVIVLAPIADTGVGVRAVELMAERPAALRGLRAADGLALALCATTLASDPALASAPFASPATDPSGAPGAVAWQVPGGQGVLRSGEALIPLDGRAPALGGGNLAVLTADGRALVRRLPRLEPVFESRLEGVDKLAVTSRWLVARQTAGDRTQIVAFRLDGRGVRRVAPARRGAQLGRPAAQGDRVVYHETSRSGSRIVEVNLRTGRRRTRLRARRALLLNPSIDGSRMLYIQVTPCGQLVLLRRGRHTGVLARRSALSAADPGFDPGHTSQGSGTGPCPTRRRTSSIAWTTALSDRSAYVAFIRPSAGAATRAVVLRFHVPRRR